MFGGKTEYMIGELRRALSEGRRARAYKHVIDNRYDPEHLVTHRQDTFDAVRVSDADAIASDATREGLSRGDVVAIDEGHFFRMALIGVVESLRDRGVDVIVAGISNDAWGRPFEPMPQLASSADEVVVKQAPCSVCGRPAAYTQRVTPMNTLHMVGGLSDYEPRCDEHFTPLPGPPETR